MLANYQTGYHECTLRSLFLQFGHLGLVNSAYISLRPKKDGAEMVKEFRPISLVHSFAKLVTKNLANRLAGQIDELVSLNQSAFIKERFIQDNFMLVQQTARFLSQKKTSGSSSSWTFLRPLILSLGPSSS